jgi:hypothetical protein
MSILDDAIREHLELKRQHGAPDDEVKKLEDEAFGPPARPDDLADPMAEAPTEFMLTPESEAAVAPDAPGGGEHEAEGRRVPDIADLQEAPPTPEPESEELEALAEPEAPAEEEQPAMEHEALEDDSASHTTQERHAIAEQPTEMFDVEGELSADAAPAEPDSELVEPPAAAEPAPTDEQLLASELEEPRLAAEPAAPAEAPAPAFDEEDDFFDEQRLSDELDQALEAPAPAPASPPTEEYEEPASAEYETVSEEHEVVSDEHEPVSEEEEESSAEHEVVPEAAREQGHEDLLEETPDFLEESPEDDELWFEQKSPKDFDFGD